MDDINITLKDANQKVKEHFYPNYYSTRYQDTRDQILQDIVGPNVIDIGCGSGWLLREMYNYQLKPLGFDFSEKSLGESRFIFGLDGLPIPLIKGTAEVFPFKDESFGSATMIGVLEHIQDYKGCMREIYRVLKNGGRFFVSVPNTYTYGVIYDKVLSPLFNRTPLGYDNVLDGHFGKLGLERKHELCDNHIIQFTPDSFKKAIIESGFKIRKFSNIEIISSYASTVFCGLLRMNRKKIHRIENLDISLSKQLPLIFGSGWMAVCEKNSTERYSR